MLYLNEIILTGNVSQAPKQMANAGQASRVVVSIAQNIKNKGEEEARYYQIWFWDEMADNLLKQVSLGDHIYVKGWVKPEQYQKNGVDVYSNSIQGSFFINYGRRAKKDEDQQNQQNYT